MKTYIIATDGNSKWIDGQFEFGANGGINTKGRDEISKKLGGDWYTIFYLQARLAIRHINGTCYSKALRELADEIEKAEQTGQANYEREQKKL